MRLILFAMAITGVMWSAAQVPVKNEPRHHNVFENEYLRVLDVQFGPGDTTLYHVHNTPSVFYSFTKTINTQQLMGRPANRSSLSVIGSPSYDSLGTARVHRVWNDDTSWFHVMDVELLGGKPRSNEPLLQDPSLKPAFNRFLANGYTVQLKAGESMRLPAPAIGYLLVSQGDASIQYPAGNTQQRFMKAGHFIWSDAGNPFSITANDAPATFMLLQLK